MSRTTRRILLAALIAAPLGIFSPPVAAETPADAALLFLPNAPYLLTDLLHLALRPPIPLWYDLALLFSCAGTGLLLGYVSLLEVQVTVEEQLGRLAGWMVAAGSLLLSGFGIYLGRFLRRNSWDPLTDPAGLFRDVSDRLLNPTSYPRTYAVTLIFGIGLLLGYVALRVVICVRSAPYEAEGPPASY